MSRDWRLYFEEMAEGCEAVEEFTGNMTLEEFLGDRKSYWSTIKMIEIIGEAARHIPVEIQMLMPDTEWHRIVGVRNVFAHGYFGIDPETLWNIIEVSVPRLKQQIATFNLEHPEGE